MDWWGQLLIIFGILIVTIFSGMPVSFSIGFTALVSIVLFWGREALYLFALSASSQLGSFTLVSIPLFVFMAEILIFTDIASDAFTALQKWLSRLPGSLAVSSEILAMLVAAVLGTSTGGAAVVGGTCIPEMRKRGYNTGLACGSTAAGGALGILIPPSLFFIGYGILTDTSVGHLFIGGILPGLLLATLFCVYIVIRCMRNPSLAPRISGVTWKERLLVVPLALPMLILIAFMLVTLYKGIAAVSEVAGVAAFLALVFAIVKRRLTWGRLRDALMKTLRITCMIAWILVGAFALTYVLAHLQLPQQLSEAVVSAGIPRYGVIILINLMLLVLGCIMDPGAIMMVTVPILVPVIKTLGFDPVWFGVMFVVNMEMAEITPPFGFNLFVIKGLVPDIPMRDIIKGTAPFIPLQAIGLALVIAFPAIVLWLPSRM